MADYEEKGFALGVIGALIGFTITGGNPKGAYWGYAIGRGIGAYIWKPDTKALKGVSPELDTAGRGFSYSPLSSHTSQVPVPLVFGTTKYSGNWIYREIAGKNWDKLIGIIGLGESRNLIDIKNLYIGDYDIETLPSYKDGSSIIRIFRNLGNEYIDIDPTSDIEVSGKSLREASDFEVYNAPLKIPVGSGGYQIWVDVKGGALCLGSACNPDGVSSADEYFYSVKYKRVDIYSDWVEFDPYNFYLTQGYYPSWWEKVEDSHYDFDSNVLDFSIGRIKIGTGADNNPVLVKGIYIIQVYKKYNLTMDTHYKGTDYFLGTSFNLHRIQIKKISGNTQKGIYGGNTAGVYVRLSKDKFISNNPSISIKARGQDKVWDINWMDAGSHPKYANNIGAYNRKIDIASDNSGNRYMAVAGKDIVRVYDITSLNNITLLLALSTPSVNSVKFGAYASRIWVMREVLEAYNINGTLLHTFSPVSGYNFKDAYIEIYDLTVDRVYALETANDYTQYRIHFYSYNKGAFTDEGYTAWRSGAGESIVKDMYNYLWVAKHYGSYDTFTRGTDWYIYTFRNSDTLNTHYSGLVKRLDYTYNGGTYTAIFFNKVKQGIKALWLYTATPDGIFREKDILSSADCYGFEVFQDLTTESVFWFLLASGRNGIEIIKYDFNSDVVESIGFIEMDGWAFDLKLDRTDTIIPSGDTGQWFWVARDSLYQSGQSGLSLYGINKTTPGTLKYDNPVGIIYKLLTDEMFGLGIPSEYLDTDSFDTANTFCVNNGYTYNIALINQKAIGDVIGNILLSTRLMMVYSQGKYKLVADEDSASIKTIDKDHIIRNEDGSLQFSHQYISLGEIPDKLIVKWKDPSANYTYSDILFETNAEIKTKQEVLFLEGVTNENQAREVGYLYWNRLQEMAWVCKFRVGIQDLNLEPGDILTLDLPDLNITNRKVRIISIEEADNEEYIISAMYHYSTGYDFTEAQQQTADMYGWGQMEWGEKPWGAGTTEIEGYGEMAWANDKYGYGR